MSEFMEYSKSVITDFLQTVVIVDDEAFLDEECDELLRERKKAKEEAESGKLPQSAGRDSQVKEEKITNTKKEFENSENFNSENHPLNAKKLSDKFAQLGLLCTALRPKNGNIENYKTVIINSDIVILDWRLARGDNGSLVKKLIEEIIKDSRGNTQKPLRSIIIYSGEDDLKNKLKEVQNDLEATLKKPTKKENYLLVYENLQIKFYAKMSQNGEQDPKIGEEELVDAIIDDFTNQVAGLVPNMALQSLAELRKNTHKILGVFSKELDEAYLSHRMLLPHPKDAENFMIDIFVSEIQSILVDSAQVNSTLNIIQIVNWFKENFDDERYKRFFINENYQFNSNEDNKRIISTFSLDASCNIRTDEGKNKIIENKEKLLELLKNIFENGYCKLNDKKECDPAINCRLLEAKRKKPVKDLTKYLFSDNDKAEKLEKELSILSTIKKQYDSPEPIMTLGTVIKKQNTDSYFICIVPRCDAARIKCGTAPFIILPLTLREETETNKKFELIIQDNEYRKFAIEYKTENLTVIILKKEDGFDTEPLLAKKEGDVWYFIDNEDNKYIWISNLKRDKAQAILNKFAAQLSRVGFNESEYLRRSYQ